MEWLVTWDLSLTIHKIYVKEDLASICSFYTFKQVSFHLNFFILINKTHMHSSPYETRNINVSPETKFC